MRDVGLDHLYHLAECLELRYGFALELMPNLRHVEIIVDGEPCLRMHVSGFGGRIETEADEIANLVTQRARDRGEVH